jgi:hypothetical protein
MPDTQMVNRPNCAVDTGFIPQEDTCIYSMTFDSKYCTVCESQACVCLISVAPSPSVNVQTTDVSVNFNYGGGTQGLGSPSVHNDNLHYGVNNFDSVNCEMVHDNVCFSHDNYLNYLNHLFSCLNFNCTVCSSIRFSFVNALHNSLGFIIHSPFYHSSCVSGSLSALINSNINSYWVFKINTMVFQILFLN